MKILLVLILILQWGCSENVEPRCNDITRASNDCTVTPDPDQGSPDAGDLGDVVFDTDLDAQTDSDLDLDSDLDADATPDADMEQDAVQDSESDATLDMPDAEQDAGPPVYDETGWTMRQNTISDSASTGTPDSYFYDVDAGSPLSASITGGGTGIWSVNVFGGYSNMLYCTGTSSCQVMLRPEDTTVIVTAVTTGIGSYSLTIRFAGDGRQ